MNTERIDVLTTFELRGLAAKMCGFAACFMLAGCLGGGGGDRTPEDIVADLPDEVVPIVIENEEEIREIIDRELDGDLQEEADEIVDLIVAVTTTTVSATSVTATAASN